MKRKIGKIAAIAATFTFSAAQAQTYTYSTKDKPGMEVGTTAPNGRAIGGTANNGEMTIVWADGTKTAETYTCIGTTQPPDAKIFDLHTFCDASGPNGSYTATFGCTIWMAARRDVPAAYTARQASMQAAAALRPGWARTE